jgi:hypothetical protein
MKIFLVALLHVCALVILFVVGAKLNDVFMNYAGLISVFSLAVAGYGIGFRILYSRNRATFFAVNRLLMKLRRTHTYWQPDIHFRLDERRARGSPLLDETWDMIRGGELGQPRLLKHTATCLAFDLDSLLGVTIRLADGDVHVAFDRRFLVPSHLYDAYRRRLAFLMDRLATIIKPEAIQCSLKVGFGEDGKNPYYGFFVTNVPRELLTDFQVCFQVSSTSECRVEAGKEYVNIEATSLSELFDTVNQVLSLRAVPQRGV